MRTGGLRSDAYEELFHSLSRELPPGRVIRDPLRTFAYGTDASFYRLVPKVVVQVQSEVEVVATVRACSSQNLPYTFRAAGTSLSGQAVSDSVLIQVSRLWNNIDIAGDGMSAKFGPAVLGGDANRALAVFGRKIGPDPASIDAAMIGGIAANNSSGMCCGNVQDTYRTMLSLRAILADGSILDTHSERSRRQSHEENRRLLDELKAIANGANTDDDLRSRIQKKYSIKNTTGYSLNALIDFVDPLDIAAHLLIGSEGTLGFISEITYATVPDPKFFATALVLFPDISVACKAAASLSGAQVAAVELMDRHSLRAVEGKPGIPASFSALEDGVAALLIELRSDASDDINRMERDVASVLSRFTLHSSYKFTSDSSKSKQLWNIRKGLFPSLGNARQAGTTILIEDVAFPCERLAEAALDLRRLFHRFNYRDAVIFGHALQGNLHFVFCVDFNLSEEVQKYAAFLEELVELVTKRYEGSLKAEHGTGRNMAPFVEREWGSQAYRLMRDIKYAFDPRALMNPGVIISDDKRIHVSNLKKTPTSDKIIEKCTECGFCERTCPSRHLSLSPRQRIATWREISSLQQSGNAPHRLENLRKGFRYQGDATCATDGLCATLCPLEIDTGKFIKQQREAARSAVSRAFAGLIATHLSLFLSAARFLLRAGWFVRRVLGKETVTQLTKLARKWTGPTIPEWTDWIPKAAPVVSISTRSSSENKVIYFPSCVSRLLGNYNSFDDSAPQTAKILSLLQEAGFAQVAPNGLDELCCGMAFSSKGYVDTGAQKLKRLVEGLERASENGKYPIVADTSPCGQRILEEASGQLRVLDISEFLLECVVPRVRLRKVAKTVAVHVPCSLRKAGKEQPLIRLARLCAERVVLPEATPCCGFAGDRGFTYPELTASALVELKPQVEFHCAAGYSSSRTCEVGVSRHSGIGYQSIAYLLDEAVDRETTSGPDECRPSQGIV